MTAVAPIVILGGGAWSEQRAAPLITATYAYAVPEGLADLLTPGQAVLAPFGDRLVLGIVWDDDGRSPPPFTAPLRELREVLDPLPLIDAPRRRLAEWLAATYAATLPATLRLLLAGQTAPPRVRLWAAGDGGGAPVIAAGDDARTQALLGLLRRAGGVDEAVIRRALGPKRAAALIAALEARGALIRTPHAAAAKTPEPALALAVTPEAAAAWRDALLAQAQPPAPRPAARHIAAARPRRQRGALLRDLAAAGSRAAPRPLAALPARQAARLLGAVALVDLVRAAPDTLCTRREALRLTGATPAALQAALDAGIIVLREQQPAPFAIAALAGAVPARLTAAQSAALARVIGALDAAAAIATLAASGAPADDELRQAARPVLLHGVTGSGKTEVYLQAMAEAVARGRTGLALVPEIALTPQAVARFQARFPGRVALLHSALAPAERRREWERVRSGAVDVVIGSRSALFAPLPDVGLIILDEEHEASYKQDEHPPTYHAREAALELARLVGAAVVLGSATPAVESYQRALTGEFQLAELPERVTASSPAPPPVTIVDLRAELRAGHTSILSRELLAAMTATLQQGEQAILYLNRRGNATCVLCRECGFVARCGHCDVPLTHHEHEARLICHYCGWRERPPVACPRCGSSEIRYFGVGTERVEATVRELFPGARVLRWDADTVRHHTDHAQFAAALTSRQTDILIGTQMIAKGLDAPGVTLVGVVAADTSLYLPDYRATERAFQLLTQVAGRAGRGATPGRVILQTFSPENATIEAAAHHDYQTFFAAEIAARLSYGFPPFRRFIKLTYAHRDRLTCQREALSLGDHLTQVIANLGLAETDLVGPAPAFIERLRDRYRWQIILRGPDPAAVLAALTPDEIGSGWSVDVDPLSSL